MDINHDDVSALTALPGVGKTTAEAIVAYREEHGPFSSVEELLLVPGFGPGTLEAIRAAGDPVAFAKMCLNNIAGAGKFSSDRTIQEYWNELWRQ